jgi:nicotinate-nucleotide pyrophosphorylase (carboxylating)
MLAAVFDLQSEEIRAAVEAALHEDVGDGDVTTLATVPATSTTKALMRARQHLTLAGIDFAIEAFRTLSSEVIADPLAQDGAQIDAGGVLLEVAGPTRILLSAERVALNFVQRLSGIATMTSRFVKEVAGLKARILDTRKTTPGWRRFEKYAVACGGGTNHRFGLFDMVLIKDNHLAALAGAGPNPIARAVDLARCSHPGLKIEVETDTLAQVRQALEAGADFILLDNMEPHELLDAVRLAEGRCQLEASGGVTLDTVRSIAETGVDFISVGALTHSAPAADIGLDFVA